uniref:G-type lectin S-receptor-like serine/threonine-protein kinase At4g03230 isoform X2 n=1 Tax=Fragaria vesca subsp. vesca TaxID=101020 RepID=UPI0005C9332C|nr:PREDICTED: G-type lectin S-receptor-like serine/threonine-protein kinase At4g03230 isoform X2 [Fragaria vesca subsp. vesca]
MIASTHLFITWFAYSMVSYILFLYVVLLLCSYDSLFCAARDELTYDDPVIDNGSDALVSVGGEFELGFFPTTTGKRYVGIWYHKIKPRTVVWVANREGLPANSTGVLTIDEEGNLCVLDRDTGKLYWSAEVGTSSSFNMTVMTVQITDYGNLVLRETGDELTADPLWQSFQYPTDTFIPGMLMDANLELTSWSDKDDPRTGNYTFKLDQGGNLFTILNKSVPYWKSGEPGIYLSSDEMRPEVAYLLLNLSKNSLYRTQSQFNYSYTRLVINSNGVLNGLTWIDTIKQWSVFLSEPKDQCSVINACGNFGSCNIDNTPLVCKCLPGFNPQFIEKWKSGDFSGGCTRQSSCSENDTFLSIKVKKAGRYGSSSYVTSDTECKNTCFGSCQCQAYTSTSAVNFTARRDILKNVICYIWTTDLNNLVEDSGNNGKNLNVRVSPSDLGSIVRDCQPCGTTTIPYPLSTRSDCGDPMYLSFWCNTSSSEFIFHGSDDTSFRVINISRSTQQFIIKSKNKDYCDSRNRRPNISLPFKVNTWCSSDLTRNFNSAIDSSSSPSVIEMGWEPPLEPTCTTLKDCRDWPNSTCNPVSGGKKKCFCNTNFQWNGITLSCTQGSLQALSNKSSRKKLLLPLLVVAAISGIILACIIGFCIWRRKMTKRQDQVSRPQLDSERRVKELIDTSDFNEEADKGIDVPFFDLQTILVATDNFSIANKLGQGGYGPVYKGIFPGGQEIAVKRLSKVSGQGLQEFKNEVVLIAKLQHRNLVRLRGYCMKGEEKILLYEYMPNKSLDSFIFDHTQSLFLNWEMRFNIILGIARGLVYLHQDSRLRIIHRDLKTSNVLLDEEMNPKISDFGLARIVGGKETEANTNTVVGTYGYMSPEYALDGNFSVKSDVFSFGVVLLEIISGKKNAGFYQSKQTFSLLSYTWGLWTEDKVLDLMDKNLEESCNRSEFMKCVNVGLLCVQEDPVDRPTMSNVITLLDSEAAIPATPKQPAFFIRRGNSSTASSSTKPEPNSEITILEGR